MLHLTKQLIEFYIVTNKAVKHTAKMKLHSEKEILSQNTIDLEYCSLLERNGIVTLDELSDLIPGYIHLNNRETLGLDYVSPKGLEKFEKTIKEVQMEGRDFIDNISDKKSQYIFSTSLINYSLCENQSLPFSFIQRLRYTAKSDFLLFYTTSKHYHDNEHLISYTQPLQILRNDSFLKEIVEDSYCFFNKHFFQFNLLTKREKEILYLIANSDSNRTISEKLSISFQTVKTHRKNICKKLETSKLIDFVKYAQVFLKK
jgi:DNA-binding CsgD family transcriptional regulator